MTTTEPDAWVQLYELRERFTLKAEIRADLRVTAHACSRAVEVAIAEIDGTKDRWAMDRIRWQSSGPRNVGTMRELAQALLDACDFVDQSNPEWAERNDRWKSEPTTITRIT